MLEVLRAAKVSLADDSSEDVAFSREVVISAFSDVGAPGAVALGRERRLGEAALRERWTRVQALIRRTLA